MGFDEEGKGEDDVMKASIKRKLDTRNRALSRPHEPSVNFDEHIWTPVEIAAIWKISVKQVYRIFELERDVLNTSTSQAKTCIRVPQSVLSRVHQSRLSRGL